MENERNESQRVLEIQGRYNLELGAAMAQEKFMSEMDAIAHDDSLPAMTPEQAKELFEIIHDTRDQVKAKKRRKALRKNLMRYGAAAAAALLVVPFAAMNVSAGRTAISNYMIQNFDKYSVIQYDQEYNAAAPFGWRSEYYPRWLPEGYKIDSVVYSDYSDTIRYIAPDKQVLTFYVLPSYSEHQYNNEEYETTEITINGQSAVLYTQDDMRYLRLYFPMPSASIQIEGVISISDLCKIAESIKIS